MGVIMHKSNPNARANTVSSESHPFLIMTAASLLLGIAMIWSQLQVMP